MAISFVNHKSLSASKCEKCGVSFGKKQPKFITSWSGKILCWNCEKKFRAFIHLG
jgi:hypothetical protein